MFELIKKLCSTYGVSGNEEEIREVIVSFIRDKVDSIEVDPLGNLIAIKKGTGKKIMLAAHMDEIGVMATYIDDKGFIRFSNLGGVYPLYSLGQKVRFRNGTIGTIFFEKKLEDIKNVKLSNLYIDIGVSSREEAEKFVHIGDTAAFVGETLQQNNKVISKALDDRSGCAVLIEVLNRMPATDNEVYFVFTVQEELGLRGAKTAAHNVMPDIAIAVDVTSTGDTPECELMEVKCGQGPAIKIKDRSVVCHAEVKKLLEEAAKRKRIPYQFEILEAGGTDIGAIHLVAGGIPSGAVSIPCRNIHSPVEMASLSDLNHAVELLCEAIK